MTKLKFARHRAAAGGHDGKLAAERGERRPADRGDGFGRIAVAGKMGEVHMAPAWAGDRGEKFADGGVGEMSVAAR